MCEQCPRRRFRVGQVRNMRRVRQIDVRAARRSGEPRTRLTVTQTIQAPRNRKHRRTNVRNFGAQIHVRSERDAVVEGDVRNRGPRSAKLRKLRRQRSIFRGHIEFKKLRKCARVVATQAATQKFQRVWRCRVRPITRAQETR